MSTSAVEDLTAWQAHRKSICFEGHPFGERATINDGPMELASWALENLVFPMTKAGDILSPHVVVSGDSKHSQQQWQYWS